MSKYVVYELFNGCEAPVNISTFGGYLAGVRVGTSDKNPLDINDTTHHTSEPVRCKDCALYDDDRLTCVRDPFHRGESLPVEPDNFCSWAEPVEDGDGDA